MRGHRRRVTRRGRVLAIALLASVGLQTGGTATTARAREATTENLLLTVEDTYNATGPSAVTTATAAVPGTPGVRLVYPTNLGANGYDHPIVAWGNGTLGNCSDGFGGSGPVLRHLASWGFAVVCLESAFTGPGTQIWASVYWLISQNSNPSSVFYGRLDAANVGAIGHSQGASGVTNATVQSDGVINSTVALALVDPFWHNPADQLPEFGEVEDPIFFISGSADALTTPSWQQSYYDQVAGPAAKATLTGADHMQAALNSRGYWTAWFRYTLADDPVARPAFVTTGGTPPELSTNPAWSAWSAKGLP
jgi:fermentation-respiration switch protein FrsA (DUF1100 family)